MNFKVVLAGFPPTYVRAANVPRAVESARFYLFTRAEPVQVCAALSGPPSNPGPERWVDCPLPSEKSLESARDALAGRATEFEREWTQVLSVGCEP